MPISDPDVRRRTRPAAQPVVIAAATGAVLLALAGCSIQIGEREREREHESAKVERARRTGQVQFDLTRPPSREEAGMPAGRDFVVYQRPRERPLDVRVLLPEGQELVVESRLVTFDAMGSPDPATGPPTTLDITYPAPTLDAGRDHMLATARQFGLDAGEIDAWYEEATSPRPVWTTSTVRSPWLRASFGNLWLEVRGVHSPPIDTPESAWTSVHYVLTWGPAPTAPSS